MEGFYNFEPQYIESRLPTVSELREIKQMLLSGDKDQILQSAEKIKTFLNRRETISEILKSDISEFLCDAVAPFDSVIVCNLYHCVELMARHVEFFTHNHSCFAVESLMRTLHFMMKDPSSNTGLNQCLNLLNFIVQGYNTQNVPPEKKTIENLLHLLPALLTNLSPTLNNKYQIGTLLLSLIELNIMKWGQDPSEVLLTNLSSWFSLPSEVLESDYQAKEKFILLCSSLCYSVLRFLVSTEGDEFEVNVDLKNDIIKDVVEFLVTTAAPYFNAAPLNRLDLSHLEKFYQAVLWFYNENTPGTNRLTHGLGEMGFLQFTTSIISYVDFSTRENVRLLCVLAVFHVVLYLSEEVFDFAQVWASGPADFRVELRRGISQLPIDATRWLDVLVSPEGSPSCKLALFLYLYFYSMTAMSQEMLQSLYPAVSAFVRLTTGIESSVLLLKVVWFVFVMSQLSVDQSSVLECENDATNEMVSLLEAQSDLSLVYTHHPALLYWAFSYPIGSKIQTQVVHLWLRNKSSDCKELDEMMTKSSDVKFAILDILQTGWGQELDSAFSSLKSLLVDSSDDDLAASIWFLLPQILAKFTADSTPVTNVDYAIELSSLRSPRCIDVTRIIRIASLLPDVLLKSDLISIVPTLSLARRLLQMASEMNDPRVSGFFLRNEGFVTKIVESLHGNVSDVAVLSVRIITLLWKESKGRQTEARDRIELPKETILNLLESDQEQVLSAAVDFLQQILLTKFQSSVFEVKDVDPGFVQVLFLEVENVCVKSTADVSNRCWVCLRLFLDLEPVQDELVADPLLNEVVLFCLPQVRQSEELREFLTVWDDLYRRKYGDPCFGRKIFGKMHSETMKRVEREKDH